MFLFFYSIFSKIIRFGPVPLGFSLGRVMYRTLLNPGDFLKSYHQSESPLVVAEPAVAADWQNSTRDSVVTCSRTTYADAQAALMLIYYLLCALTYMCTYTLPVYVDQTGTRAVCTAVLLCCTLCVTTQIKKMCIPKIVYPAHAHTFFASREVNKARRTHTCNRPCSTKKQ